MINDIIIKSGRYKLKFYKKKKIKTHNHPFTRSNQFKGKIKLLQALHIQKSHKLLSSITIYAFPKSLIHS